MKTMYKGFVFFALVLSLSVSAAFAADLDLSNMKRSEIVSSIFVKGSTKDISDGYGVTGTMKVNTKFVVAGVLTAMQTSNGGDYKTGDTVEIAGVTLDGGITATAWFSVNKDEDKKSDPEITEIAAKDLATSEDLAKHFVVKSKGQNGEIIVEIPANVKFTVYKTWTAVSTTKGNLAAGDSYTTGSDAEVTTWWPKVEEPESEDDDDGKKTPEVTEIKAEQLISAEDLAAHFETVVGEHGEVAATIPAYTRFSVYKSWATVTVKDGSSLVAGASYETGAMAEMVTFWPDPAYWDEVNSVEITSQNIATYLQPQDSSSDSKWTVYSLKDEAKGKKLRVGKESGLTLLVRNGDDMMDPDVVDETTEGEIVVAKTADIDNEDGKLFSSLDSLKAAAPVEPTISRQEDGKYEVVFYAGSDKLFLAGANLFKYAYDKNRVEETEATTTSDALSGKMLKSKDGYVIGTITVYLSAQNTSGGNGGSGGGGGCNSGLSAATLLLLPVFFQKGKKSN